MSLLYVLLLMPGTIDIAVRDSLQSCEALRAQLELVAPGRYRCATLVLPDGMKF